MRTAVLAVAVLIPFIVAAAPAAALAAQATPADLPRVFLLDAKALAETRARAAAGDKAVAQAVENLRRAADKSLKAGPFSVMDKKDLPPSHDRHDYMSLAPYWWPDPSKPDGKPYIRRDGEVHEGRGKYDNVPMDRMADAVIVLAQGWYFTRNEAYAERAALLLRTWFLDEKTRMNPNLNYGQMVPGVSDGRGAGLIDTADFINLVDAVGLLAGSRAWTAADQKGLEAWFEKFLAWMQESEIGRAEARAGNNHGTWYDAQAASYALFAGKTDVAKKILADSHKRIDKHIEPDGRQPAELARTKSWDYSTMNLRGWCTVAALAERAGVDLWTYESASGGAIRKALDYLLPYATGETPWPHKQIVKFQPDRLVVPMRYAAAHFSDKKYADALRNLAGDRTAGDWRDFLFGVRPPK